MAVKLTLSLLLIAVTLAHGASILDYLDWDDGKKLIEVPELREDQPNRNCMCKGPACVCCVDFNITFVDLGGPGCVHMKYVSPDDGFSVNVSYGKNVLHSSKIQGKNPEPVCLEVFGKVAQVCAKFSDLAPTADGLRGCLELQPRLMGKTQLEFPIGCFRSTAGGMEMEDLPDKTEEATTETVSASTQESSNDTNTFDVDTFMMVYQSAEKGVEFLNSLFTGIPDKLNTTRPLALLESLFRPSPEDYEDDDEEESADNQSTTPKPEPSPQGNTRRGPKTLKHPNQL